VSDPEVERHHRVADGTWRHEHALHCERLDAVREGSCTERRSRRRPPCRASPACPGRARARLCARADRRRRSRESSEARRHPPRPLRCAKVAAEGGCRGSCARDGLVLEPTASCADQRFLVRARVNEQDAATNQQDAATTRRPTFAGTRHSQISSSVVRPTPTRVHSARGSVSESGRAGLRQITST
jgi:hypothetical protein